MFQQVGNFVVESEGKHKLVLDDSVVWPNDASAPSSNVLKCRSCDEHCYNGKKKVDRVKKLGSNTWNTRDCLSLTSRRDLKISGALQLQTKMGKVGSNISHTRCRVLPYFQSAKKRVGNTSCAAFLKNYPPRLLELILMDHDGRLTLAEVIRL